MIVLTSDAEHRIANIFSQYDFGHDKNYTDYDSLREGLEEVKEFAMPNHLSIAIPYKIGCGLAGGDWNIVYKIIEDVFDDYDVTIYKLQ